MIKLFHRGDREKYPENTFEAIESSLFNYDCNGFETDIKLTKDNKWIIFHDDNTKRMCNVDLNIKETNYNELPPIIYQNKKYKIPLLEDITNFKPSLKIFNLEIKESFDINDSAKKNLINLLKKINSPIIISSFIWEWYDWCLSNKLYFGHLIEEDEIPINGEFWIIDYNILNEKIISKVKEKNIKLGCFTIKNKKEINYNYDIEIWDN